MSILNLLLRPSLISTSLWVNIKIEPILKHIFLNYMIIKPIRSCLWAPAWVMATLGMPLNNVDLVWLTFEAVLAVWRVLLTGTFK